MIAFLSMQNLTAADWAIIARVLFVCLLLLGLYTFVLYRRIPKHHTLLIGQEATVAVWDGRDRRVEVFGAIWQAQLPDHATQVVLKPGDRVRVHAIHNLILTVSLVGDL